ncbi:hypothetical protein SMACR_03853 [Sordaria macrospora]|uniref:WGS project CABT00000000 data, contig 2.16 n=2 Tax=Sordaria macrospora TaxID=5147 RepID=F7W048_SORMK|nr:uncharacterized protein SMAC_03853 [Sordaria macrospora k-hell]KAA8636604.1 hypothetical protein SMACR_03853 [Sordaria macrospora]KAH7629786.1 hypothetical protein B0T09DRAFT_264277 [Sordaria sp. MPI-SDFR-AT-0083]WPJ66496.1 hypothetical protein SMAC4_03853 [Sordaria macrospora]CCC11147.1 unnamed protein product [Sordaria macrospora k-hell]
MADHDTNLRRSKRLRTEKATLKASPAPKKSDQPPKSVGLPAAAGFQSDNPYCRPPYKPIEAPEGFDVAVAAGSMTARPYRSQLKDLSSSFQTDLLAFAATRDPLIASLVGREFSAHKKQEIDRVATTVEFKRTPEAKEAHSMPPDTKSSPVPKESVQTLRLPVAPLEDVDLPAVTGPHTADHYVNKLESLSNPFRLNLLAYAAVRYLHIGSMVEDKYASESERLNASAGSFKPYLQRAYHLLNERYAHLPSSLQVDLAHAVYSEIDSIVSKIVGEVTRSSSFEMKKSALEAMRQILHIFCKVPETLRRELKTVLKMFTPIEMEKLGGQWDTTRNCFGGFGG